MREEAATLPEPDDRERKTALLGALLPDVPFDGWSIAAMRVAAQRIGMDEAELGRLFPRGPRDAVAWFSHWADYLTMETMAARPQEGTRLSDRVALAVRTRLDLLAPHREAARRAASFLALPLNAPLGLKLLYDTVDALWYAAGDGSTDFSFYTKRGILAGVYVPTMLYWLDDRSSDGADSAAFLERRLADAMVLPRLRTRVTQGLGAVPNPFRAFQMKRTRF